ncbi:MAG TPA: CpsD/CapB family tyrosine-protein kinase [Clostridia bacterium]|nr:CpsD/CapB family tyrosine-protein kinase [Clostridia bacterium]
MENKSGNFGVDFKSPVFEAYRTLRTNIEFSGVDKKIKTILITSASSSEGKSTTCANLAVVFAQMGSKTLLVDADLRKPVQHKIFNTTKNIGLTSLLSSDISVEDVISKTDFNNLFVLSCGIKPPNPSELISSARMKKLVVEWKDMFDVIIIDSPPVGIVTDASILSSMVDATIVVVSSRRTEYNDMDRAIESLRNVNANIVGTVLNNFKGYDNNGRYNYRYNY